MNTLLVLRSTQNSFVLCIVRVCVCVCVCVCLCVCVFMCVCFLFLEPEIKSASMQIRTDDICRHVIMFVTVFQR